MTVRKRRRERKSDATRKRLLERALKLFQQRGVEATTMRDVARAAGLALGAVYYYFPSKDALVFAFYEASQEASEAVLRTARGGVRERLGAVIHAKLEAVYPQRRMLASIVQRLVDPGDPLSALSQQQRAVRERAIAVLAGALDGADLPPAARQLAAHALWLFTLGCLLLAIHDESPEQARTHRLVDDALDIVVPALPLVATPLGIGLVERVTAALARAGVALPPAIPQG